MASLPQVELHPGAAYALLAELTDYPGAGWAARLAEAPRALAAASPVARGLIADFARSAAGYTPAALEELYTQTFDLQPECTLNLGHHLFGEDWKRSTLLIELKPLYQRHGIDPEPELPDHLCWLLRLFAAVPGDPEVRELVESCLRPAVRSLEQKLARDNPYATLLQGLYLLLANEPQTAEPAAEPEARR